MKSENEPDTRKELSIVREKIRHAVYAYHRTIFTGNLKGALSIARIAMNDLHDLYQLGGDV